MTILAYVSVMPTGCMYREYDRRRGYQKATSPFYKRQIWACFGMTRVDTKFEQGLG